MPSSLSNIADNIAEGVYKIKCKDCDSFLNMKASMTIQKNISVYLVIKIIQTKIDEKLKNGDFINLVIIKLFISLLRNSVHPYEYMYQSEKFNESAFPEKHNFIVT